jgi:hypothetical protein
VVHINFAFAKAEHIIGYLGRYTHKIAISNHRILNIDKENKTVTFSLKEYKNGGRKTTMTLTSTEFIRRFQMHVLPKGFTRLRHYGFLSSSWKKEKLADLQLKLADKDLSYVVIYEEAEKSEHRCCPSCKEVTLVTLMTFGIRGPPKNYKAIIKRKLLKYSH